MCESAYINTETQMMSEVYYVAAHFRTDSDHRYKVILRDIDSDSVAGVVWFPCFDEANQFAEQLVFPSAGLVNSPTFLPVIR
jgi:hypothetical protein